MLGGIKNFIKSKLITDSHPLLLSMWKKRFERKLLWEQEMHSRMTYAELEAEISRRHEAMFGRKLDWDNPRTYNEKIHVSKIYMPTPLKTRLADKVAVREWVAERIGSEYLVPLLGVYASFDDIDFDALPDKFVIKCTHDSKSTTVVKDKSKINTYLLRLKYDLCLSRNWGWNGFEMHYRDIPPKIIIEPYLGDAINDYKFLCFDGRPCYCWVDFDRYTNHKRNMYNLDWELQPFNQYHYGNYEGTVNCPENFGEMKRIVAELCKGFEHVRVDLYVVGGRVYFGEMTFTPAAGLNDFYTQEFLNILGDLCELDTSEKH